ncbi:MAG: hypothetical protein OEX75_10825, partial [Gammaproteobacteria bacterium]|nr:hypothetical protein [Gammaproteobacteria bacterium]
MAPVSLSTASLSSPFPSTSCSLRRRREPLSGTPWLITSSLYRRPPDTVARHHADFSRKTGP